MSPSYRRWPGYRPSGCVVVLLALVAVWILVGVIVSLAWGSSAESISSASQPSPRSISQPVRCEHDRRAVSFYRQSTWRWQELRGGELADRTPKIRGRSCHWVDHALAEWVGRSRNARRKYERHLLMLRDPDYAIEVVFREDAEEAKVVSACESGDKDGDLSPHVVRAQNGQYLGMFQMGASERRLYGHGSTPYAQAIAAHRYFVSSGRDWSPWSCKPW